MRGGPELLARHPRRHQSGSKELSYGSAHRCWNKVKPMPGRVLVWALAACLLVAGCDLPGAQKPDARSVLRQAAQSLAALKTVTADIKFGPGVTFDNFGLASAATRIRLPADSDTTL